MIACYWVLRVCLNILTIVRLGSCSRDVDVINNSTCFHVSMSDVYLMTACTEGRNEVVARFSSSIRAYIDASSRSMVRLDSRERSLSAIRCPARAKRRLEIRSFMSKRIVRRKQVSVRSCRRTWVDVWFSRVASSLLVRECFSLLRVCILRFDGCL